MNRLGVWSASALCVIGVAYVVTLAVGFASAGFAKPIVDPVLAVMEILTLLSAPILVVLMAAVHAYAAPQYKVHSLVAFAFMVLMAGLTSSVHFVELTAVRQSATASLTWPSTAYALELLAWDLFLGLSLLFAAPVFTARQTGERGTRWPLRRRNTLYGWRPRPDERRHALTVHRSRGLCGCSTSGVPVVGDAISPLPAAALAPQ